MPRPTWMLVSTLRRRRRWSVLPGLLGLMLAVGCTSLNLTPPLATETNGKAASTTAMPNKRELRVSQFLIHADFELNKDWPIFQELAALRDQVYKDLQLPTSNTPIQVYVFENRERYKQFMAARYPELPDRRAFFVAQPRTIGGADDLLVYTYWGDRVQQDLRHELTHAMLHCVLKGVPIWLDEGLAEYYEVPSAWHGTNSQHLEMLQADDFKPNLARLEGLTQVKDVDRAEYSEAWGWAHLMLQGPPEAKAVLLTYLQQLRTNATPGPLAPRLKAVLSDPENALLRHLARVESRLRTPPATVGKRKGN